MAKFLDAQLEATNDGYLAGLDDDEVDSPKVKSKKTRSPSAKGKGGK